MSIKNNTNTTAAVRLAFGSTNPMACLRGRPNRKGPGIFYVPGVSLEVVRFDDSLNKFVVQEFAYGLLGAHDEMLFSAWPVKQEKLKFGCQYRFAGMAADVRFPRMSLNPEQEKSLQRGRFALVNHHGQTEDFAGPNLLVKYEEMEVQRGNVRDIWSPKVIGKRGASGCAIPGSPLADLITMYKSGGHDIGLDTPDLELMQKLSGYEGSDLFMPISMCDEVVPQALYAVFPHDYSRWTIVTTESLKAAGIDRTMKEYDDEQVAQAQRREAAKARKEEAAARAIAVADEQAEVEVQVQTSEVEQVVVDETLAVTETVVVSEEAPAVPEEKKAEEAVAQAEEVLAAKKAKKAKKKQKAMAAAAEAESEEHVVVENPEGPVTA
jgi:hypothetical protein